MAPQEEKRVVRSEHGALEGTATGRDDITAGLEAKRRHRPAHSEHGEIELQDRTAKSKRRKGRDASQRPSERRLGPPTPNLPPSSDRSRSQHPRGRAKSNQGGNDNGTNKHRSQRGREDGSNPRASRVSHDDERSPTKTGEPRPAPQYNDAHHNNSSLSKSRPPSTVDSAAVKKARTARLRPQIQAQLQSKIQARQQAQSRKRLAK